MTNTPEHDQGPQHHEAPATIGQLVVTNGLSLEPPSIDSSETLPPSQLWSPEESPRGFKVQMLSDPPQPVAPHDVFTRSEHTFINELNRRLRERDGIRLLGTSDKPHAGELMLPLKVNIPIEAEKLARAQAAGLLPGEFKREGFIQPDEVEMYNVMGTFPAEEQQALERNLQRAIGPDFRQLPKGLAERQTTLTQAIVFEALGKQTTLYNFSPTHLTARQVGEVANAIREMADLTGGSVLDMLDVMAIVPNDDPEISYIDEEGRRVNALATAPAGSIIFSEGLFNLDAPHPTSDPHPLATQIDTDHPFRIGKDEDLIQLTTFHELAHLVAQNGKKHDMGPTEEYAKATGWEWSDEVDKNGFRQVLKRGDPPSPVIYGRTTEHEDISTAAEGFFAGGHEAKRFDSTRIKELGAIWEKRHSGKQGPAFVTAVELPLSAPFGALGPNSAAIAIIPQYTYVRHDPHALDHFFPPRNQGQR